MRRVIRWTIGGRAILALAAAALIYWLFYDNRLPRDGDFPLDLAAIRAMATRMPGPGPARIEVEELSHTFVPKIALLAASRCSGLDRAT